MKRNSDEKSPSIDTTEKVPSILSEGTCESPITEINFYRRPENYIPQKKIGVLKYFNYIFSSIHSLNMEHLQLLLGSMPIVEVSEMRTFYSYNLSFSMYS